MTQTEALSMLNGAELQCTGARSRLNPSLTDKQGIEIVRAGIKEFGTSLVMPDGTLTEMGETRVMQVTLNRKRVRL